MAYVVEDVEVSGEIKLLSLDPSGETFVRFQRPRRSETEVLSKYRASTPVLEWDDGDQVMRQKNLLPEPIMDSERVALCLVDSNLEKPETKAHVFVPGVTCRQGGDTAPMTPVLKKAFYAVWLNLTDDVAEAIINALHGWHPPFDWKNPKRGEA